MAGAVVAAVVSAGAVELDQRQAVLVPPVNDAPRWYMVMGSGGTDQPVPVMSLSTGRPIAYVPPGYKFLAFGANARVVTLGVGGQVGYIPAVAASEMYPVAERVLEWKAAGPTLEEQAEVARKEAREAQAKGLEPLSFKKKAEERKAQETMGQAGQIPGGVPLIGAGGGREGAAI